MSRPLVVMLLLALAACDVGTDRRRADGVLVGRGRTERRSDVGRWTLFRSDGSRELTGTFVGGQPNGVLKLWHQNGRLHSRTTVYDRVPHGPAATFRADGSRESAGDHRHGRRDGPWRFWREDGTLDEGQSGWYRDGVRVDG